MIEEVRKAVRVTTEAFDDELKGLLAAAKADLELVGILSEKIVEDDPLIKRALLTFVKAHFGWNNPDYERLIVSYATIKQHLRLSGDYANV